MRLDTRLTRIETALQPPERPGATQRAFLRTLTADELGCLEAAMTGRDSGHGHSHASGVDGRVSPALGRVLCPAHAARRLNTVMLNMQGVTPCARGDPMSGGH